MDINNNEIINCCCERFSIILQERILSKMSGENAYSNCKTLNPAPYFENVKQQSLPGISARKTHLAEERPIFDKVNLDELGSSPLEQTLKNYNHAIVACHIGTLDSGNKYALIIGTSDEWVNVITYNRAKEPVYQEYGFSIKDNRWSYGSNVHGAPQIRIVINSH